MRPHVSEFWHQPPRAGRAGNIGIVTRYPATRKIYTRDGHTYAVGETLRNPDMAHTWRRIAEHGAEDFYSGEIAARIVLDMQQHGGLLSMEDLAACVPDDNPPLWGSYRGYAIATNQSARRRHSAAGDAQHPGALRPARAGPQFPGVYPRGVGGDEDRHRRQGRQGGRSSFRARAGGRTDLQAIRRAHGGADPRRREDARAALQQRRRGKPAHNAYLRAGRRTAMPSP